MSKNMTQKDFNFDKLDNLLKYVDLIYEKISTHVMNVLNEKYMLTHHLEALKKYLLLGQGDFIQCLMDAIGYSCVIFIL
jgi:gamma-tubulin complex component 3